MSNLHIPDAGALKERPEILRLNKKDAGYEWAPLRKTWAKAELTTRRNVWSVHGIGASGVTFTLRKQDLNLTDALLWKGQHCFISSILPLGSGHIIVEAALVTISQCMDQYTNTAFPAVMTEEYHKHEQLETYAVNTMRYVLVTPKDIVLKPGNLVDVDGSPWPILTAHLMDPNKNEYIIERMADL